jgi:branched-chain amino acid transport system permease protein
MVMPSNRLCRRIPLLFLLALAGCGRIDLHQAELCEEVARVLFAESRIERVASERDAGVAHGVVTSATLREANGGATQHRIHCGFASSGPKSEDQLALAAVASDVGGQLDAAALDELRAQLEQRGVYWKVSWIPTFGGPRGELAPASASVASLYFLQLVVNGLTYGAMIGLVAIGYTLIYGAIGVVNLAFGDIYMIGAFVTIAFMLLFAALGVGPFLLGVALTLPLAMAITAGYSAVTDRLVFRELRQASAQMPLIASIGLSLVLQATVFTTGGAHDLWMTTPGAHGVVVAAAEGFELYVNREQVTVFVVTLLLVALTWLVLFHTAFGRAQRACAQDRRMAALLGIDVDRVIAGTFGVAGALAGAGGLMAASYWGGVGVTMGVMMGLKGFTAAVVGGVGNVTGAALGGFVVALLESFAAGYFYGGYKEVAVFALLILLLIFRPQGILGDA